MIDPASARLPAAILVANRGEVAVRVIRACRELGIRAVAVHSAVDRGAYWTRLADEAVEIGPAPASQSYLDIATLIAAGLRTGATAIHPGYGLLSESAAFAQAACDAGLVFIGPDPETIALMGDKVAARGAAVSSGVPVLPGSPSEVMSDGEALRTAEELGWPLVVKASFGGGGRGMRVAHTPQELSAALAQARREAEAAFGRAEIFLERYLERPRHVEVQILADTHGTVAVLGDRDCSVQRRHQKLIEEAPAPNLGGSLRHDMHAAASRLCRDVGYTGAGTVEFLVDGSGTEFFFLEMNTRLQVEHGVTELVTGIDIVREQILIACGARLAFSETMVSPHGHAIQARITAEDPWRNFGATPGKVESLQLPAGPWVRCDFGFEAGDTVPVHYDSLLGKVHAWGRTRDEARTRLAAALSQTRITGIATTTQYLRTVLDEPAFVAVQHDTGSLEREWLPTTGSQPAEEENTMSAPPAPPLPHREVQLPWGNGFTTVAIHGSSRRAATAHHGEHNPGIDHTDSPDLQRQVSAPMDGVVRSVDCTPGTQVRKGEQLLLLEAMKMEVVVAAPRDGVIEQILAKAGEVIRSGETLATLVAA